MLLPEEGSESYPPSEGWTLLVQLETKPGVQCEACGAATPFPPFATEPRGERDVAETEPAVDGAGGKGRAILGGAEGVWRPELGVIG